MWDLDSMDPTDPSAADQTATMRRIVRFEDAVQDRIASEVQRLPIGVARLSPELPHCFGLNAVQVTRPVAPSELCKTVKTVFAATGIPYRKVVTTLPMAAWVLAPALYDRRWSADRLLYMLHDRLTSIPVSPLGFREVDVDAWSDCGTSFVADKEWGHSADVQHDMAVRDRRLAERAGARFILSEDGSAGCHVYRHGPIAQIEELYVLSSYRGRGLGTGLMAAALAACADAQVVFLVAYANNWQQEWYGRLGFTPAATRWEWLRHSERDRV